jgi:hypothetical protein
MSEANSSTIATPNELGAYRSISTLAVLSFILGLLSLLSFAPSMFFVFTFPPVAIILGLLAVRQIRAAPEVYTGIRLAKLGVALGLVCGVVSVGTKYINTTRIGNHGHIVADRFVNKLKAGDTAGAFWLKIPREGRAPFLTMSAKDLPGDLKQQYVTFCAEATPLSEVLARGEATLEFDSVEQALVENGTEYAAVVYKIHSPRSDGHILVLAASYYVPESRERSWHVKEFKPGYSPNSFTGTNTSSGHEHVH